jgi:hypothetical protein
VASKAKEAALEQLADGGKMQQQARCSLVAQRQQHKDISWHAQNVTFLGPLKSVFGIYIIKLLYGLGTDEVNFNQLNLGF